MQPPETDLRYARAVSLLLLVLLGFGAGRLSTSGALDTALLSRAGPLPEAVAAQATPPNSPALTLREQAVADAACQDVVAQVYAQVAPAVVSVQAARGQGPPGAQSGGSGFVLRSDGYIATNYHVVQGAAAIVVTLSDGTALPATLVGYDARSDLAVLKVDAETPLTELTLGDSDAARIGELVMAVGNPLGLERSLSVGVISGLGREVAGRSNRTLRQMLQTDAALNPGNSGGPLVNARGEVIGVATAVAGAANSTDRIGFAVPVNTLKRLLPDLLRGDQIRRPFLGIRGRSVDAALAQSWGLAVEAGVAVLEVLPGTPAARAGLRGVPFGRTGVPNYREADVIIAVNGQPVRSMEDLLDLLDGHRPGDSVQLTVQRGLEVRQVAVTLGEWPDR